MFEVVVLAAGRSSRFKTGIPKVFHRLLDKPILGYVLDTIECIDPDRIHVVINPSIESEASKLFGNEFHWVCQHEPLGTGHAFQQVLPHLQEDSYVLIVTGDSPLLSTDILKRAKLLAERELVIVTADMENPKGYGRIVRDHNGTVTSIVEDRDANESQQAITEINSGIIGGPANLIAESLRGATHANSQNEIYLTEIARLATDRGEKVHSVAVEDPMEVLGVNDRSQLAEVEQILLNRCRHEVMLAGTTLRDPLRFDLRGKLKTGIDCTIDVNVIIEGDVTLGDRTYIGPGCILRDVKIGDDVSIQAYSVLDSAIVGNRCSIGPFARIRPDTDIGEDSRIGNFVEIKNSKLGKRVRASHLAYLGDATLGDNVNVGAGAVTCNFDGQSKHGTIIGEDVFIGTNSTLVAPLYIEAESFIAAGSTITHDVKERALVVGRSRQRSIKRWNPPSRRKK